MILDVVIPGEPKAKARPRFSRSSGRAYTPAATEQAEQSFQSRSWVALREAGWTEPHKGPISVEVVCVLAVPASWAKAKKAQALSGELSPTGRPDVDNYAKLVMDALNGIAWVDDAQVVQLSVGKRYGEQPETRLHLWGR